MISKCKHKSSRELDVLIATKFYGFEPYQTDRLSEEDGDNWWIDDFGEKSLPYYSTEEESALKLWTNFVNTGKWCCTELYSDYTYVWGAKIIPGYPNEDHTPIVHIESKSLPRLICNAVLDALDYLK